MRRKHVHHWSNGTFSYVPPTQREVSGRIKDEDFMKCVYGFTIVSQRCTECNELRSYLVTGKI